MNRSQIEDLLDYFIEDRERFHDFMEPLLEENMIEPNRHTSSYKNQWKYPLLDDYKDLKEDYVSLKKEKRELENENYNLELSNDELEEEKRELERQLDLDKENKSE